IAQMLLGLGVVIALGGGASSAEMMSRPQIASGDQQPQSGQPQQDDDGQAAERVPQGITKGAKKAKANGRKTKQGEDGSVHPSSFGRWPSPSVDLDVLVVLSLLDHDLQGRRFRVLVFLIDGDVSARVRGLVPLLQRVLGNLVAGRPGLFLGVL